MIRVILVLGAVLIVGTLTALWIARRKYRMSSGGLPRHGIHGSDELGADPQEVLSELDSRRAAHREIAPSTERRAGANGEK